MIVAGLYAAFLGLVFGGACGVAIHCMALSILENAEKIMAALAPLWPRHAAAGEPGCTGSDAGSKRPAKVESLTLPTSMASTVHGPCNSSLADRAE